MNSLSIAGYEISRLLRDRALPLLLALLLALGAYAAWNGSEWVSQREAAIGLIKAEEQDTKQAARGFIGKAPSVLPRSQPVLPPGAMAPLSIGQSEAYPYTADVVALGDYTQLFKHVWADIGNPAARAAGRFDLAFVIVFLLPLIILAITYDLWSRERERGIAALLLSQPISAGQLIVVKALVRGCMVLLPTLGFIVAVAAGAGATSPAGLATLALTVFAYGCFWLAAALLIGFIARRTTEAAIAAGALWLLIVVMAPSLTLATVNLIAPPPSQMRFATQMKAQMTDISKRQQLYHQSHPATVRSPSPTIPDQVRDTYADRVAADLELAPLIASQAQATDARRHALDTVRFFLPSVAVQDALDRIAGSDADRAIAFQIQVAEFWQARRRLHKVYLDRDSPQTLAEYEALPRFQFIETGSVVQRAILADIAAVFAATLILLIAAWSMRGRVATP